MKAALWILGTVLIVISAIAAFWHPVGDFGSLNVLFRIAHSIVVAIGMYQCWSGAMFLLFERRIA